MEKHDNINKNLKIIFRQKKSIFFSVQMSTFDANKSSR